MSSASSSHAYPYLYLWTPRNTMSQNEKEKSEPHWKVFRKDTEAGRLLNRLYGTNSNSNSRDHIHYPKLKKRENGDTKGQEAQSRSRWNSGLRDQQRHHIVEQKQRGASVRVPKVGIKSGQQKKKKHLSVHMIPRRRTENLCQKNIEENEMMNQSYRPPNSVKMSSDLEKVKLRDKFENEGGNCLPLELTSLPRSKIDESDKTAVEKNHIFPNCEDDDLNFNTKSAMTKQILKEIQERRLFQKDMERSGAGAICREAVVEDITKRLKELMHYDKPMAIEIMSEKE